MLERRLWRRNREVPRAACRLKARLGATFGTIDASVMNLSRTGVLLRVKLDAMGIRADAGVFEVGRALTGMLGEVFTAEILHPMEEGRILVKDLVAVRLGTVRRTQGEIEIGCRFTEALQDEETSAFGIRLPGAGDTPPARYA